MDRAYCLTCNEQVTPTAGGTCALGHPVTAQGAGPEPWVGFAGDDDLPTTAFAEPPAPEPVAFEPPAPEPEPVTMDRIDEVGRPVAHAGSRANGEANGHANGHTRSLGGGHGSSDPFPSTFGHRSSFSHDPEATATDRAPAAGQESDDLAALLAQALDDQRQVDDGPGLFDEHVPTAEPSAPLDEPVAEEPVAFEEPVGFDPPAFEAPAFDTPLLDEEPVVEEPMAFDPPAVEDPAPAPAEDWDDLASLAAELQLETDVAETPVEDMPVAAGEPEAPVAWDVDEVETADMDALLAELTGEDLAADVDPELSAAVDEPVAESSEAELPPPPPMDVAPAAFDAPPPPEGSVPPPPPPPMPAAWDELPAEDVPPAPEDVPSAPPAPADVDLMNFTASGRRVGEPGAAAPVRKRKFGWKR